MGDDCNSAANFSFLPITFATSLNRNTSDFSVSANGVLAWRTPSGARQLAWFDRSGKQIEGLDALQQYFDPKVSPEASRIAVTRLDAAQPGLDTIWLLDIVRRSA